MGSGPAWPPRVADWCWRGGVPRDATVSFPERTGGQGFPRTARLLTSADFQRVFAGARRIADRHFTILARPNELGHPRLGLAVSRRTARRAVQRNRLRRLVRETFRRRQADLPPLDLVVIAKPSAVAAPAPRLHQALETLWSRVAVSCETS